MLAEIFAILVVFAILVGIWYLFQWAIAQIGPPAPLGKIAQIVLVLVIVGVVLLYLLPKIMGLFGVSF
jgi:hypothetical protein